MPLSSFTDEQLDLLSEHAAHAAQNVLRTYRRGAIVGFLVLLLGVGLTFTVRAHDAGLARKALVVSTRNVAVASCNARYRDRITIRGIVRGGKPQILRLVSEGTLTPEQGRQAIADEQTTLDRLKLPDCRQAAAIITDDPTKLVPNRPPPLYPGHGG